MKGGKATYGMVFLAAVLLLSVVAIVPLLPKAEATTTVISSDTTLGDTTVNAGDTLIIDPGVTVTMSGTLTNNGNILNSGTVDLNFNVLDNYGIIIDAAGGTITSGTINNYESGIITEDSGSTHIYADSSFNNYGKHTSYGEVQVSYFDASGSAYKNFETGVFESHGNAKFLGFFNYGGLATFHQGALLAHSTGGGQLYTNGTINNYGTLSVQGDYPGSIEIGPEGILNNHDGGTILNSGRPGYDPGTAIYGTLNNDGDFLNTDSISNFGIINNNGFIEHKLKANSEDSIFDNLGTFNNNASGEVTNFSIINNLSSGTVNNAGTIANECDAVFNNEGTYNGNPIVDGCSEFPVVHMEDRTESYGVPIHPDSNHQIAAEWIKSSSVLVGKQIDSVTLKLQRIDFPTGLAQVVVLDVDKNIKHSFGNILAGAGAGSTYHSDIPTTMTEIEFTSDELYTIQADDRIGIIWGGGSGNSGSISVMMDKVTSDSVFDGTNTQRIRGTPTGWYSWDLNEDLWMVLKQTHG
jgi:hypothetical protein